MPKNKSGSAPSLPALFAALEHQRVFAFLDTGLCDQENRLSYVFTNPVKIISCRDTKNIPTALRAVSRALNRGYYCCGFLSYEAGYAFEKRFPRYRSADFPLLWMGVFAAPRIIAHRRQTKRFLRLPESTETEDRGQNYCLSNLRRTVSQPEYLRAVRSIKRWIEKGDTYQVNYTLKYKFDFSGSVSALYRDLRENQPVNYGAFLHTPSFDILSFSPELFFRKRRRQITVRPMKGTARRGKGPVEDARIRRCLAADVKNRAENLMIVDLLRNDLGRICQTGSVRAAKLFTVEPYKTVFQMTSTVQGRLKSSITAEQLLPAIFPSGSVTGAPKIRTMQIIRQMEKEERKIYTGSIGFFAPDGRAVFNVAIRTVLLQNGKGEMGIGSGVTHSSKPAQEYEECLLKAKFLQQPRFKLLETMRWSKKHGFFLLAPHLRRLRLCAKTFGFVFSLPCIKQKLFQAIKPLSPAKTYKIRLLLGADGSVDVEASAINTAFGAPPKIILSRRNTNSHDKFLYHKTTSRRLYDREYEHCRRLGFYDVLFKNEREQITEGAVSNVFIKKNGFFYTPKLNCGLLPGVFREYFLRRFRHKARERVLTLKDLKTADEVYLCNSVRGMVKVKLESGKG